MTTTPSMAGSDMQSMISRKYSALAVLQRPGAADDSGLNTRCRSAHSETVSLGGGFVALRAAIAAVLSDGCPDNDICSDIGVR